MANYQLEQTGEEVQAILNSVLEKETTRPVVDSSKLITSGAVRNALLEGYLFKGMADHSTNPGIQTEKVFYIASDPGIYYYFGTGISVEDGEVVILKYDTTWHKEVTGAATVAAVLQQGTELDEKISQLGQAVIYDVSANNDGATFASLSALLLNENLSTLIPVAVRCGGMSIRFIQTSDNKYVQYRLMADTFSTTESDWQGIDTQPSIGSHNLVTGDGIKTDMGDVETTIEYSANSGLAWSDKRNEIADASTNYNSAIIPLAKGGTYSFDSDIHSAKVFNHYPHIADADGIDAGETYTPNSQGQYMLVTVDLRVTDTVIVNISSYGLAQEILTRCLHPQDIVDNLSSSDNSKVLSAKQGKILNEDINGVDTVVPIEETIVLDSYINTNTHFKDGSTTFNRPIGNLNGCGCCKIAVSTGDRFSIYSSYRGNTKAVGFYILTGNNDIVLSALQECSGVVNIEITENGYLYVNLNSYNSQNDYVKRITTVTVGGYRNYVDEKINEIDEIDILNNKKIVCFGDSLTEFKDIYDKTYSDYISEIYHPIMINCGIGGSQFRQRTTPVVTPSTNAEGYAGMDVISMVMAACGVMYDANTPYSTIVTNAANYIKTAASDDNTEIVQRLLNIDWSTVDGVILFAGTNDWKNGVGHWGETGSNDVSTTLGAINKIIELLLSTYKHLKIYWFTPIVRWLNYDSGTGIDADWSDNKVMASGTDSANLRVFSKMIQDEVTLNHIPVCDTYNTLGINQSNFSQYFNDNDGTHPRKGNDLLAKKIASFIISNNTM